MNTLIIGNAVSLVGALLMVGIGLLKEEKKILAVQNLQFGIMVAGNLVLGGVTGAISNGVCLVRNLLCMKIDFGLGWKLFFVAVQAALSLMLNRAGVIGLLPLFAACSFTLCMGLKNEVPLKLALIFGQMAWAVYDFSIMNYTMLAFDILSVLTNLIALVSILAGKKTTNQE